MGLPIKKAAAFVLAFALALVTLAPTGAAKADTSTTEYSITVQNVSSTAHTYNAYQIFSGTYDSESETLADIAWGNGIQSAQQSDLLNKLKSVAIVSTTTIYPFTDSGDGETALSSAQDVADALSVYANNSTVLDEFISAVTTKSDSTFTYLTGTASASSSASTLNDSGLYDYKIDVSSVGAGYYLVMDASNPTSEAGDSMTAYILQVAGSALVNVKGSAPTVKKEIQKDDWSSDPNVYDDWGEYGDYEEGQAINYRLIGTLPQGTGSDDNVLDDYESYSYTFTDTMSAGLSLCDPSGNALTVNTNRTTTTGTDGIHIYIYTESDYTIRYNGSAHVQNSDGTWEWVDIDPYYVLTGTGTEVWPGTSTGAGINITYNTGDSLSGEYEGGTVFKVSINDINKLCKSNTDSTDLVSISSDDLIVVTYYATLNENAVVGGSGNPNKVQLSYSDNPADSTDTGYTTESEVRAFTYELNMTKVTSSDNTTALGGAEFVMYYTKGSNNDAVNYYAVLDDKGNGTYYLTGWTKYKDGDSDGYSTDTSTDKKVATVITTPSDESYLGKFNIIGIDSSTYYYTHTYYFEEVKAPEGYNLLKSALGLNLTANYGLNSTTGQYSISSITASSGDGLVNTIIDSTNHAYIGASIPNNPSSALPGAGGIGTRIFYTVGGILVACALMVFLFIVFRKRIYLAIWKHMNRKK